MTTANNSTDLRNGVVGELGCKAPARVASLVNITLEGEQTINGVAVVENDIVLVTGQADQTENGVYIVSTSAWERAVWFDNSLDAVPGTLVLTTSGTQYARTIWVTESPDSSIDFGTSIITFSAVVVFSDNENLTALAGLAGAADLVPYFTGPGAMTTASLTAYGRSLIASASASAARTVLGLGTSAIVNTGVSSGNVPLIGTQSATTSLAGLAILINQITIANNSLDVNNDIDFSVGSFQFSDGSGRAAATALTKRLDANWVAGNNQGGLDTGSKANSSVYQCFAIYNPTTLISDFIFSLGLLAPTVLPSGFNKSALVGQIATDSSGNIRSFFMYIYNGLRAILFNVPVLDYTSITQTTANRTLAACSAPANTIAIMNVYILTAIANANTKVILITNTSQTDTAPSGAAFTIKWRQGTVENASFSEELQLPITSTRQFGIRANDADPDIDIVTKGWYF